MNYYTIQPPEHLARYVRFFWVLEGQVLPGASYVHRCMADGCAELLFHYKGHFDKLNPADKPEDCFSSGIQGQSHEFKRFTVEKDFGMFGVYFYPYAIPQLFAVASPELTNQMPDLESFLGKTAEGLEEQMVLAADTAERVKIITAFLEKRLASVPKAKPGVIETINHIMHTKGTHNVDELAQKNFLSVRQFERNFKELSGFSPKLFSRIIRFQSALNEYHNKEKSLTEIAYDCGYYDQSHFIHEFKEFSGHHPKQYFSGKAEGSILQEK